MEINLENTKNITPIILHNEKNTFGSYGITHMIRKMHDGLEFEMTDKLTSILKKHKLYETKLVTKYQRQKYNKSFKELGILDQVMIEHLISVKNMVEGLWDLKEQLPTNNFDEANKQVNDYLIKNTDCIVKLKYLEKELHG